MKLNHVANKILLADTKKLADAEREALVKLLHHLKEIDKRKLFCDLKYPSLFTYCVQELGYSEGAAHRRIVAARALAEIPEIEKKIEDGRLSLTNISLVNQFIEDPIKRREVFKEIENLTKNECEQKLFEITGKEEKPKDKKKRISKDKIPVAFVLSDETMAVVDQLKNLLAKEMEMDELIQFMAKKTIESVEKTKFKQTDTKKSLSPAKVGRAIPASIKRAVYARDKKCTNCGTTYNLNYDHILPYSMGGPSSVENLRLLCSQCNQRARIKSCLNSPKGALSHSDLRPFLAAEYLEPY
ncbi:HNH endonuclease [Peredibacter starrii]|uniref:HNH endonuclease signature motif containing protein n=1 Tax=Peredibacter starrii TaxID=28202 RepID=A0AAX4HKJ5_9BACT|nr:HNH endonuclease signature motif containing protein [Peredibacter starrii]WPU63707.1 HNH endonuclease signature motif containing protein [Peredibacter starrii]